MSKYTELKERIHGPVFSIVTPFLSNDAIDFDGLEKSVERIHDAGAKFFYVMGYNSRFALLTNDEIKEVNKFVTQKVKDLDPSHIMIIADPLHSSTKVSTEFAQHGEEIGADIISLIVREKYYSDDQILRHYERVAQESGIGILVHEMPFLSGYGGPARNWTLPLLDRVVDIPNVVAVKEDAKDDAYSKEVIAKIKDRASIVISGGGKRQWLRFADDGCQSWLNGIGVFDPRLAVKFYEYYQAGEKDKYMAIVDKIEVPFFEQGVKRFGWHLTIKAAMEAVGVFSRHERSPLMELSDADAKIVADLIKSLPVEEVVNL